MAATVKSPSETPITWAMSRYSVAAESINSFLERHFELVGSIFVFFVLATGLITDVRERMWFDEFLTLNMAHLSGPREIVKATMDGADGIPPLYAILVRFLLPLIGNDAVAVRLPATIGFCVMTISLLILCKRRLNALYSLLGTAMAVSSVWWTISEGRPYAVALAFSATAFLSWQFAQAQDRRWIALLGLALSLAFATSAHYYFMFVSAPLLLAELAKWRRTGKPETAVLAAIALPVLAVLAIHYPLFGPTRRFQAHFWSPANWHRIPRMIVNYGNGLVAGAMVIFGAFHFLTPTRDSPGPRGTMRGEEWLAFSVCPLMPFAVLVFAVFTTHAFVARYVLWADLGVAILLAALISRMARNQAAVGVAILGALLFTILWQASWVLLLDREDFMGTQATLRLLNRLPKNSEPIVLELPGQFLEMHYYSKPLRDRLICSFDPDLELLQGPSNTNSLIMEGVSHHSNLRIFPIKKILATLPRFIFAPGPYPSPLPSYFEKAGFRVTPIPAVSPQALFEVEAPASRDARRLYN